MCPKAAKHRLRIQALIMKTCAFCKSQTTSQPLFFQVYAQRRQTLFWVVNEEPTLIFGLSEGK